MKIESIKKVSLGPDDVVIISCPAVLSLAQRFNIQECVDYNFKDNKVLILDGGLTIDVLSKQDIEDMK
jgi:hypothetical protein